MNGEPISIGRRDMSAGHAPGTEPWAVAPDAPDAGLAPGVIDVDDYAHRLLDQARADARGKASASLWHSDLQRIVGVALVAGGKLAPHASPPAATLHCLSGRMRLYTEDREWICGAGQIVPIPPERHGVDCLEEGVFLLTVSLER